MSAKSIILEQLRSEKKVVEYLLVKRPKPDLEGAMAQCQSLRNISNAYVNIMRALFHTALVVDPYYLNPKRQRLSHLNEEHENILAARDQAVNVDTLDYTEQFFWMLSERIIMNAEESDPLVNRFEVQTFRAELIRLLTGVRVDPVVNRWRKKW